MKAQSLDNASSASRTAWSSAGFPRSEEKSSPSSSFCTDSFNDTMSATCAPSHTRQSLPLPHDDAGSSNGAPTRPPPPSPPPPPLARRPPPPANAPSPPPSHNGPSCHQCPYSSVS